MDVRSRLRAYLRSLIHVADPPDRNPVAIGLCLSLAIVLAPTAIGLRALPGSLQQAPDVLGQACSLLIVLGSLAKVFGNLAPTRDTGLPWELLGSFVLSFGCVFYAAAVYQASPFAQAQVPFSFGVGLALGCFARGVQIGLYVRARVRAAQEG